MTRLLTIAALVLGSNTAFAKCEGYNYYQGDTRRRMPSWENCTEINKNSPPRQFNWRDRQRMYRSRDSNQDERRRWRRGTTVRPFYGY